MEDLLFESLENFLNEDLGNLKVLDLPPEFIQKIVGQAGTWSARYGGAQSEIKKIENPTSYKGLLKELKLDFIALVITLNGSTKYFITRESDRKYKVFDADMTKSRKNVVSLDESLNERRRSRWSSWDRSEVGSLSVNEIIDLIEKLKADPASVVEAFLILSDEDRIKKIKSRSDMRSKTDPLSVSSEEIFFGKERSSSQKKRISRYAEKKKIEVDKKAENIIDDIKDQINNNLDDSFEKLLKEIRRGYSWYANPKSIGETILKGVDLKKLSIIVKAYAVLKDEKNPEDLISGLKKLGFR